MQKNYPNRRSIRLHEYDYSQQGLYFITLCALNYQCLFGKIDNNNQIHLSHHGKVLHESWLQTADLRPNVILGEFIIMPNHFHAIFSISETNSNRETPPIPELSSPIHKQKKKLQSPSQTVGAIVRGYKSAVSKQLGFSPWQRNYHEHIIRNNESLNRITQYIISNPANWKNDCFYIDDILNTPGPDKAD